MQFNEKSTFIWITTEQTRLWLHINITMFYLIEGNVQVLVTGISNGVYKSFEC